MKNILITLAYIFFLTVPVTSHAEKFVFPNSTMGQPAPKFVAPNLSGNAQNNSPKIEIDADTVVPSQDNLSPKNDPSTFVETPSLDETSTDQPTETTSPIPALILSIGIIFLCGLLITRIQEN